MLGADVGYQIRFDNKTSEDTRLRFVTDALLLREMMRDPLLTRYSVVVMDDAHERSLSTDLLFGLLRKILLQRPQFRVVVCSATLDADAYVKFFTRTPLETAKLSRPKLGKARPVPKEIRGTELEKDWKECFGGVQTPAEQARQAALQSAASLPGMPANSSTGSEENIPADVTVLSVEGRCHPVAIRYLDQPTKNYLEDAMRCVLEIHKRAPPGDILVFLTGQDEIDHTVDNLNNDEAC
jgi:ATP-dependent RNA helicase DDX35